MLMTLHLDMWNCGLSVNTGGLTHQIQTLLYPTWRTGKMKEDQVGYKNIALLRFLMYFLNVFQTWTKATISEEYCFMRTILQTLFKANKYMKIIRL